MSTREDGGPAFAAPGTARDVNQIVEVRGGQAGMSLRDYFAAQAMQGILASGAVSRVDIPCLAYTMADAMLAQRGNP